MKKILFQSDCAVSKTGFGRNAKAILSYLYKTGKYDLAQYCVCQKDGEDILKVLPWRSYGAYPKDSEEASFLQNLSPQEAEAKKRLLGYGEGLLDRVIEAEKPDVYFAVQDIWGIDFAIGRKWFESIDSILWTTLDSLPILDSTVDAAKKVKNFWVWSEFAEKEMHKMGLTNVRTMHGAIDDSKFFRKSEEERLFLREKYGANQDDFIVGFVFRNQLRKSVFALLKGLYLFKNKYPDAKVKVLLHTCLEEGWDINKFISEFSLKAEDVYVTFACKQCGHCGVEHPKEKIKRCPKCENASFASTSPANGISEEELNDIYNLMNVYCHPFTSGGQEMPIQEAKLSELITLVTNYTCGEDNCVEGSGSLPLSWEEYREPGTQFIKAATSAQSICDNLEKVYRMDEQEKRDREILSREWAYKNYSIESVCGKIEKFIDNECNKKYDYKEIVSKKYPNAAVPQIKDDKLWVKSLYKNILNTEIEDNDKGLMHWLDRITKGEQRQSVENYFRAVAFKEEQKGMPHPSLQKLKEINGKKLVVVIKSGERECFYSLCVLKDLRRNYPDYSIIIACPKQTMHFFEGNENVNHIIEYTNKMSEPLFLEGKAGYFKYCDVTLNINDTFANHTYMRNGADIISQELLCI